MKQDARISSTRRSVRTTGLLFGALILHTFFQVVPPVAAEDAAGTPAATPEAAKEEEKPELINTGVIANSGSVPTGSAVNVSTQGAAPGDESSVIRASVSQASRGKCVATLSNGSETNTYSTRFRVVGTNESGAQAVKRTFAATLKPGQEITRDVTCKPEYSMSVVLVSASKR
jgi:hypothetical protein